MKQYTREDAAHLIDKSEGRVIDSSKPAKGHAQVHVGSRTTPALDMLGRRKLTTMYRNRTQAEKDLRDWLDRHSEQLELLPAGGVIDVTEPASLSREVYIAEPVGANTHMRGLLSGKAVDSNSSSESSKAVMANCTFGPCT